MENKKLTRSNNRMLAGVCAGLADYFGWDVTGSAHYLFICHGFHSLFGHYCLYNLMDCYARKEIS